KALSAGSGGGTRTDFAPTGYTILQGSWYSGDLNSILVSDDVRLEIDAVKVGTDYECDWYASTFASYTGSLLSLDVTLESNYTAMRKCAVYLWNWKAGVWDAIGSATLDTSDATEVFTVQSPTKYLSTSGEIRARFFGRRTKALRHRTDLVDFTLTTQ